MNEYLHFRYIWPPRPEVRVAPETLGKYEDMGMSAQPKMNGSCCEIYTDGTRLIVTNRHKTGFAKMGMKPEELIELHSGEGWMVLVGEYMNKSQKDSKGKVFNHKFVIFDILVYEGQHLVGSTFAERLAILDTIFPETKPFDEYIDQISENVFRVKTFDADFQKHWKAIVKIQMYEGWVMKRPSAKLENGTKESNNVSWQIKCRKETKNYT